MPQAGIAAGVDSAALVVVGGLVVLLVVLVAASAAGFAMRHRQGRFRPVGGAVRPESAESVPGTAGLAPGSAEPSGRGLSSADLGAPLGARATLVQFSTDVCAYCGPTRKLLTEVARWRDGVEFVEVDAAKRMDLTRRLHVMSTPTVLVLDALGGITSRSSGPQRRADLETALSEALTPGGVAS